ncbi:MAG: TRAP transporter small permease, partial [Clostridiaceae bacterium]|nr:TRAP transporter small permease [Clostridiaceae bacterium]
KHVGIDILLTVCPVAMRKVIQFIIAIIGFLFSIFLIFYGWKITHTVMLCGQLSTAMMMPMYLVYIAIPIGGFLMCVRYFQIVLVYLKDIRGKERGKQQC